MKQYFKRGTLELYQGDKINYDDILCVSPLPSKYHTPIIELGVHAGWEMTPAGIKAQQDDLTENFRRIIQERLDNKAKERGYDHILSLSSYSDDPSERLAKEGQAGKRWRSEHWEKSFTIMKDVFDGKREIPTEEEFITELPAMLWPDQE